MTSQSPVGVVPRAMQSAVLAWFDVHGRTLAFRSTKDPYAILVSELMAQQTQISRVVPSWESWLLRFPTLTALAGSPVGDVIRQWAGLGYNRRAVNLHRAARLIVERHGGQVPRALPELMALPGIGPYTARAVAAIAFAERVGAVDTNVRRVLGRVLAGSSDALPARRLQAAADASVPARRPGDWTHALMDLGARFCRPRAPRCGECPVAAWCRAASDGAVASGGSRAPGRSVPGFPSTSRWLRGRIVERLRAVDGWAVFDLPVGTHDVAAVHAALTALHTDGVVELATDGPPLRARLPG